MVVSVSVLPEDAHNRALVDFVHPADWVNPEPSGPYNLVAIGAGTAGLVSAAGAAGLGAKVALIERHLLGGDCLNMGCVPSKALIRSAKAAFEARGAEAFGVPYADGGRADFGRVMEQLRALRAGIARHDAAARFAELGVDVYLGDARFTGPRTVEVGGKTLEFSKAVIATGARAKAPPIPGLDTVEALTNETLFSLTELPGRMAIVGAGPIGVEMAQSFARLGTKVFLVDRADRVLSRETPVASRIVAEALRADGVELLFESEGLAFEPRAGGVAGVRMTLTAGGTPHEIEADRLLVAVGRAPNVEGLGLDAAGVRYDARRGVEVDAKLRTSNKRIFAAGDVASRFQFTHTADAHARIVIRNALFPFLPKQKTDRLIVPWVTYSDPEVAHVGLTADMAAEQGVAFETVTVGLDGVDRAILDRETEGFIEVLIRPGKGTILGATLVARHAGETISQLTTAIVGGVTLGGLAGVIHPYPTQAEVIKKAADQFNRGKLTPRVQGLFRWLMARQR